MNLGDGALWIGINFLDDDCYTPYTNSYGTRTWYGREWQHECCPASAYLDPNLPVASVWDDPGGRDVVFSMPPGAAWTGTAGFGLLYRLGFPDKVAGCGDCHTSHTVLPMDDPKSSVNPANLVGTCAQGHPKATPFFAKYYSHGEMTDRENYPILYWTFISMTGLHLGTFAVFWIHTLLWMFRGFVENREKLAARHVGHEEHLVSRNSRYTR